VTDDAERLVDFVNKMAGEGVDRKLSKFATVEHYPRIGRAVENRIRMWLGPLAPVLTPLLLVQLQPRLHISESDLEPIRSIGRLRAPVMVVAGSRDEHTTWAESQELFGAAAEPKQMWVVEGAKHQDLLRYDPKAYEQHVVGFLKEKLGD
jgi:uncharacterized protein